MSLRLLDAMRRPMPAFCCSRSYQREMQEGPLIFTAVSIMTALPWPTSRPRRINRRVARVIGSSLLPLHMVCGLQRQPWASCALT